MTSRDVYFFGNACAFSSRKAVSVPTSVMGGLGAPWRPAILCSSVVHVCIVPLTEQSYRLMRDANGCTVKDVPMTMRRSHSGKSCTEQPRQPRSEYIQPRCAFDPFVTTIGIYTMDEHRQHTTGKRALWTGTKLKRSQTGVRPMWKNNTKVAFHSLHV